MKTTASNLIQWAGVSATVAGIMYVLVGLLHPFVSHHGGLSSVTTDVWVLTHSLTIGVSFFGLLGIATLRAGILSRWAAGLFGFGAVSSLAFALVPPALEPLATVPVGLGLAWLGYGLWSERRESAADSSREIITRIVTCDEARSSPPLLPSEHAN